MTGPLHFDLPAQRDEWLAWRAGKVTATRITAIMGVQPWAGPWTAWREITGQQSEQDANALMAFGSIAEGPIAETWARQAGHDMPAPGGCWTHPEWDRLVTSTDYRAADGRLLEIKTGVEPWDTPPQYYAEQLNWEIGVLLDCGAKISRAGLFILAPTGTRWRHNVMAVALAAAGQPEHLAELELYEYEYEFDENLFTRQVAAAQDFLADHCDTGIAPKPNGADLGGVESITLGADRAGRVDLDPATYAEVVAYQSVSDEANALYKRRDDHRAPVALALGDAVEGWWEGRLACTLKVDGKNTRPTLRVYDLSGPAPVAKKKAGRMRAMPAALRDKLAAIKTVEHQRAWAVAHWPADIPAVKRDDPDQKWTADELARLEALVTGAEQAPAPSAPADPELIDAARKRLAGLNGGCRTDFGVWAQEGAGMWVPDKAAPTRRQQQVTSLVIDMLDRFGQDEDLHRAVLAVALGDTALDPTAPIGSLLATLTEPQADRLRDQLPAIAGLPLAYDDDGYGRFVGATDLVA